MVCLRSIFGRYTNHNTAHSLCCVGDLCGEREESNQVAYVSNVIIIFNLTLTFGVSNCIVDDPGAHLDRLTIFRPSLKIRHMNFVGISSQSVRQRAPLVQHLSTRVLHDP